VERRPLVRTRRGYGARLWTLLRRRHAGWRAMPRSQYRGQEDPATRPWWRLLDTPLPLHFRSQERSCPPRRVPSPPVCANGRAAPVVGRWTAASGPERPSECSKRRCLTSDADAQAHGPARTAHLSRPSRRGRNTATGTESVRRTLPPRSTG